jgi:hypothetical protein
MEATRREFQEWEQHLGARLEHEGGWDEFTLPDENTNELSCNEKLAYVARLLRSLAMSYGVTTDYISADRSLVADEDPHSPAAILRGLNASPAVKPRRTPENRGEIWTDGRRVR